MKKKIILASASPRRRELLKQIDMDFEVVPSTCEEIVTETEPQKVVMELSEQKTKEVFGRLENKATEVMVLGADTIVVYENKILGKPKDKEDAVRILTMLAGKTHQVYTGVTFLWVEGQEIRCYSFSECTIVTMFPISEKEISDYVASGEPMDKAGAYGIQGRGAAFIRKIEGDYNNVVGLPVGRVYQELKRCVRKKGVIFDLDGTLTDTLESIAYSVNLTLNEFGFPSIEKDHYRYFVGDGAAKLIQRALLHLGDEALLDYDKVYKRYCEIFEKNCMYQVMAYPQIKELLQELRKQNIKIGVLSNKPHERTKEVIRAVFGDGVFESVMGQKEDVERKPSPQGVYNILKEWNLEPEEIIYVGDTNVDMKTGLGAGAYSVGVLWGFRDYEELQQANADAIIEQPLEILNYLM